MPKSNPYKILGISESSDANETKRAFRRLAMRWHPDRNGGSKEAEARFREIRGAYETLTDPEKRREFDAKGAEASDHKGRRGDWDGFGRDLSEMFEGFFSTGGLKGESSVADVSITFAEALLGCKKRVSFTRIASCGDCGGKGVDLHHAPSCKVCSGSGRSSEGSCRQCSGSGIGGFFACKACGGTGQKRQVKTIELSVPEGVDDGVVLRVRGEGHASPGGSGPSGDLFVSVLVAPDKSFVKNGKTIRTAVALTVSEAVLGCKKELSLPSGKRVVIGFPARSNNGDVLRLQGLGSGPAPYGELLCEVLVSIPKKLSKEQTLLFKKLGESGC